MELSIPQFNLILEDAKNVHTYQVNKIDFKSENKRQAIYILQGGILTATISALRLNDLGYIVAAAQQKRIVDEGIDLITFFDELSEDARQINAWFQGKIVERVSGNRGNLSIEERAKIYNFTTKQIRNLDELKEKLKNIMSIYMHPTIETMRANMDKSTHLFDYENQKTSYVSIKPNIFAEVYIIPTLHALLLPRSLLLNESDFNRLRNYDLGLQKILNWT